MSYIDIFLNVQAFEQRSNGFLGIVGAIDGCHIPCKQPKDNAHDYYNRKGFHSIILQGIIFTKIYKMYLHYITYLIKKLIFIIYLELTTFYYRHL